MPDTNSPLRIAPRPLRFTIPFLSRAIRPRFSLFTRSRLLFPTFFTAHLHNRRPLHWNAVTRFQVPPLTRNHPQLSNSIYSPFNRPAWLSFFLSLSPLLHRIDVLRCIHRPSLSCSPACAQHPPSFLKRSILPILFSPIAHAFFFPPPSLSPLLGLLLLLFSHSRSSALLDFFSIVPFLPLRASNFLPSSTTSSRRRGDTARKSPRTSRYATAFSRIIIYRLYNWYFRCIFSFLTENVRRAHLPWDTKCSL